MAAVLAQDIALLENQNDRLLTGPDRKLVDIRNDSLRIMARRTVERLIASEQ